MSYRKSVLICLVKVGILNILAYIWTIPQIADANRESDTQKFKITLYKWILVFVQPGPQIPTKFWKSIRMYVWLFDYSPESKYEALRLGVHLILLYFIRISLLTSKIIFILWIWMSLWVSVLVADFFCL